MDFFLIGFQNKFSPHMKGIASGTQVRSKKKVKYTNILSNKIYRRTPMLLVADTTGEE